MTLTTLERAILLEALHRQQSDVLTQLAVSHKRTNGTGAVCDVFRAWLVQADELLTKIEQSEAPAHT